MPELPEVETVRKGLEKYLLGRRIERIEVLLPRVFRGSAELVLGMRIVGVGRRGKLLMLSLENEVMILVHLRMTGQLLVGSKITARQLPDVHTRIVLYLDGEVVYFQDQRTFGYMEVVKINDLSNHSFLSRLGMEPLEAEFVFEKFAEMLEKNKRRILKSFLLDQTYVAGIGNIYADEACFRAGIVPWRKILDLSIEERMKLYAAIREVLSLGVSLGGASAVNYVDVSGGRGDFMRMAMVYRQNGMPCRICGSLVLKKVVAGRGTHWCANCQS